MKKAKRTKFGFFKNKKAALAYIVWRRKNFSENKHYSYFYNVMKMDRSKSDKGSWLAYSLMRRIKGR